MYSHIHQCHAGHKGERGTQEGPESSHSTYGQDSGVKHADKRTNDTPHPNICGTEEGTGADGGYLRSLRRPFYFL